MKSVICLMFLAGCAFAEVVQDDDGSGGTISFQTPTLNDEESHSMHMPPHLKCDGCIAVVYQVSTRYSYNVI